jgi:hypothetical protein
MTCTVMTATAGSENTDTVMCAEGSMAMGGGASCEGSQLQSSQPVLSNDKSTAIGWKATCGGCKAKTYAVCCCAH